MGSRVKRKDSWASFSVFPPNLYSFHTRLPSYFQHRGPHLSMNSPFGFCGVLESKDLYSGKESSHTPLKPLWVGSGFSKVLGTYWISAPFLEALCGLQRVTLSSCAFYFSNYKDEGHSPCLLMGYHKAYQAWACKRLWTFQRRE